jgi:4Fe-4S ferredoxin
MSSSESCSDLSGRVAPVVDRNRCEGKEDCVAVCPYNVFEIGTLSRVDRSSLSMLGKIKAWAHANKQVFVVNPGACHACKLCINACPENALTLRPHAS